MKVKDWLIHKLGGKTREDLYKENYNFINYKQGNIITYKTQLLTNKNDPFALEQAQDKLAMQMLVVVKENMEIEYIDIPEINMIMCKAILRLVKVE